MNPIKIGMIGFGRMGGFYLEQMQKSGRWEVAYICDVSAESREEARRLAPQAQVIADEQIIFDDQASNEVNAQEHRQVSLLLHCPRLRTARAKNRGGCRQAA